MILVIIIIIFLVMPDYSFSRIFRAHTISKDYIAPTEPISINTPKGIISSNIANTNDSREQGLSGVKNLNPDSGLLFVFPSKSTYGFWMKDMNFALDIVWINEFKEVVGVSANVLPSTYPDVFYPPTDVKYVLETNAGTAEKFGLKKGIKLDFLDINAQ